MANWTVPAFGMTQQVAAASTMNTGLRCVGIFRWVERDALNGEATIDCTIPITYPDQNPARVAAHDTANHAA